MIDVCKWASNSFWSVLVIQILQLVHSPLCILPVNIDVQDKSSYRGDAEIYSQYKSSVERSKRYSQSKQRECEQSFVYPAYHYPYVFMPMFNVTHVAQRATHEPCQEAPAHCPDEQEEAING